MNRKELIGAIAEKTGNTKADTGRTIEALIEVVTASLKKGDRVSISGFGKFKAIKERPSKLILIRTKYINFDADTKLETAVFGATKK